MSLPVPPTTARDEAARRAGHLGRSRRLGFVLLGLLAAEFLAGMALNLYQSLPTGSALSILASSPVLLVHIALGVMILGSSVRAAVDGARSGVRGALVAGVVAAIGSAVAFLAGMAFTFGGQAVASSYGMAVGFAVVLVGAAGLLGLSDREAASAVGPAAAPARTEVR
jgi:hypothetical protein